MKKIVVLTNLILIFTILFCSCSTDKISSVSVDDKVYRTIYLYSFKDAQIDKEYDSDINTNIKLTTNGFVYSTQKLLPGEKITVWNWYFEYCIATVDEVIEVYRIEIKSTSDTYKITYYSLPVKETVSEKRDIQALKMQKIEVVKERVIITYE